MLANLDARLTSYKNSGLSDEYLNLAEEYNAKAGKLDSLIDRYNEEVNQYNSALQKLAQADVDSAFNECIDPTVFRSSFDQVDLGTEP